MKRHLFALAGIGLAMLSAGSVNLAAPGPQQQESASPVLLEHRALLDQYCVTCHNQRSKTANLTFDTMDLQHASEHAEIWEKVVRKLRGDMMPPPGARRPPQGAVNSFVSWMENTLDQAAVLDPNPGRIALHRLNRREYAVAINDLLGIQIDAAALLPQDDEAEGFDNVANVLKVSPSFLDQYISAARQVVARAAGNAQAKPGSTTYRPARGVDQSLHVEGLPLGTRGGLLVEHLFPADGEYKINISGLAGAGYVRGMEYPHTLIVTVDGVRVFQQNIGGPEDMKAIDQKQAPAVAEINGRFQNIPINTKAGPHQIGVTFIARTFAESDEVLYSFKPGNLEERIPRLSTVEIVGPFNPTGVTSTPSRDKIFTCLPPVQAAEAEQTACAQAIISSLARRAFRRPVTERDLVAPLAFFKDSRDTDGFEAGIQSALTAILSSPKFLYRVERRPENVAADSNYSISGLELAARLSFFLSGGVPDDELLSVAEQGRLQDPVTLERQVRRLLADPKSKSRLTNFAFQWLKMRPLDEIDPDAVIFPNFDDSLRGAFRQELSMFVQSIFSEDRSVLELLTADHTFLNERLALHYGVPNIRGTQFRRVTLTDPNRFGLLGKGSFLMVTSYANRTAPVLRGAWILENIMGTPPSPPPPNVEAFPENKEGEKAKTVREIMVQHRANPSCNGCHGLMDPLGFAFENFDAIGEFRAKDRYAGTGIDASGSLADGSQVNGPVDVRQALLKRPGQFVQTFTENLMTFALGRTVEYYDMPVIRKIVRDTAGSNYRFSSIVMGIVTSPQFQMRRSAAESRN